jgi:type II secretory pathway pseudopilin PulG
MQNKHLKKGFSLVETVVTIMIYAVMLFMITNVVLLNSRLSMQLQMRSRIRAELEQIATQIKRDIRNADLMGECNANKCRFSIAGNEYSWNYVSSSGRINKTKNVGTSGSIEFESSPILKVNAINFTQIVDPTDSLRQRATIIITLDVEGANPIWKINNQIVQEIVSTRNFQISI